MMSVRNWYGKSECPLVAKPLGAYGELIPGKRLIAMPQRRHPASSVRRNTQEHSRSTALLAERYAHDQVPIDPRDLWLTPGVA